MPYFLDTHVLLWMRQNDPRLSRARWEPIFHDPINTIYFSIVSLWEIAIKRSLGKLKLEGSLEDFARTLVTVHEFQMAPIEVTHLSRVEKLPPHHRDPFDRILIAQAIELGATAITDDPHWKRYGLKIQW
jgi:PIN domain nuclease of toxin-antitoxin system